MREPSRDRGRLMDMFEYSGNAIRFSEGLTFEDFVADRLRYFAIMKNVEIIGEAANMLTSDFREQHPDLPWAQIIGMRHVLVHGYAQISDMKLWNTATKDMPFLHDTVARYLAETNWEEWESRSFDATE